MYLKIYRSFDKMCLLFSRFTTLLLLWIFLYQRQDLNLQEHFCSVDFKSTMFTNFITLANKAIILIAPYYISYVSSVTIVAHTQTDYRGFITNLE